MNVAKNITELIGNTPLVRLNKISDSLGVNIYGKCEFLNPTHSVKDRIGYSMIINAINSNLINSDTTIIEPTSGNTGIALASICATLGLKLILTMPSSMSLERRKLLQAFGAKLELTPAELGMRGAIEKANELNSTIPNSIILQQFENPNNPKIHRETTALEIIGDLDGHVDCFVAAVGTGGTLSGTSEVLKEQIKGIKIVAVEPKSSAVISGNKPSPHKIQGIGAGFIPKNLNVSIFDTVIQVSDEDAIKTSRELALTEGLLVGISAGANVYASMEAVKLFDLKDKNIVTILCDTGERYLSSNLYE